MKKQQGFTLIELMIVVAIIAILAAIAIPQYQTYVARSQVTRLMGEAGQLKTAVEDCLNNGKTELGAAAGECDAGATGSSIQQDGGADSAPGQTLPDGTGAPVIELGTGPDDASTITATAGNSASTRITGDTVVWTRNAAGSWSCTTNTEEKYRPSGCAAAAATPTP